MVRRLAADWAFTRVWHLEPSLHDAETVYAGVEDAALFKSTDGGAAWAELSGLRKHDTGPQWQPGAGGMCLHTILQHPSDPERSTSPSPRPARSAPATAAQTWQPINKGLRSGEIPDQDSEVGHCVHRIDMHPSNPDVLYMQKHWDVMRSKDGGDSWQEVSGNLPTDFGFPIAVHAHEPETIYVVPITSDSHHYPPDGKLRVYRSRTGGDEWEALTEGLPQADCYVNVLRDAMAVDQHESCGVYFGTTVARSTRPTTRATPGRRSSATCRPCCRSRSRRCHERHGARRRSGWSCPRTCASMAKVQGEVHVDVAGDVTQRSVLDALEARVPDAAGHHPRPGDRQAAGVRPVLRLRAGPVPRGAGRAAAGAGRCAARSRSWSSARWPAGDLTP